MWLPLYSAPYGMDLELANFDHNGVGHRYELPCRKVVCGWIDVKWQSPIEFKPTHWRPWKATRRSRKTEVKLAAG
jgi:hypothetical protein